MGRKGNTEAIPKKHLEPTEEKYRVEEKIFLCFQTACKPGAYLRMENQNGEVMLLYMKDETIVYLEMKGDEQIGFLWIPILPLAIGAYADFIKRSAEINRSEGTQYSLENKNPGIEIVGKNKTAYHPGTLHMILSQSGDGNTWQWKKEDGEQIITGEDAVNRITEWFALMYSIELKGKKKWQSFQ